MSLAAPPSPTDPGDRRPAPAPDPERHGLQGGLLGRGFLGLMVAQFGGAANDNLLRGLLLFMIGTGVWQGALDKGGQAVVGLAFTVPFILLSGWGGQVADRISKARLTIYVKIAEVPIVLAAGWGLYIGNLGVTLGAFLALAVQSSFFGPAKYGIIPELVNRDRIAQANGGINMFTNIAVIVGSLLAGIVADKYFPKDELTDAYLIGEGIKWLPLAVMLAVSLLGMAAAFLIPRLEAKDPGLKFDPNPFGPYVDAIRDMGRGPLLGVVLAWATFYIFAFTSLLIVPQYEKILEIDYTRASYLLAALGISIGVGSVAAGAMCGRNVKPMLIFIGAVGLSVMFMLLGIKPGYQVKFLEVIGVISATTTPEALHLARYLVVLGLISLAGMFAGLYLVPLQALIQGLAPNTERGRFVGTANAMSFCGSMLGAILFWFAADIIRIPPIQVFFVNGGIAIFGTIVLFTILRRPLYTAAAMMKARENEAT